MSGHRVMADLQRAGEFHGLNDPGDGEDIVIAPDGGGMIGIVTAAAETRTLKDPPARGIDLTIYMDTDGGNCVITADTSVNESGHTTITLSDAGQTIALRSIEIGGSPVWREVSNSGITS